MFLLPGLHIRMDQKFGGQGEGMGSKNVLDNVYSRF